MRRWDVKKHGHRREFAATGKDPLPVLAEDASRRPLAILR